MSILVNGECFYTASAMMLRLFSFVESIEKGNLFGD